MLSLFPFLFVYVSFCALLLFSFGELLALLFIFVVVYICCLFLLLLLLLLLVLLLFFVCFFLYCFSLCVYPDSEIFVLFKYNENNRIKQKYYNIIKHYFDNRIRTQANKCLYQSVFRILNILKINCSDRITDNDNLEEKNYILGTTYNVYIFFFFFFFFEIRMYIVIIIL